MAQQFRPGQIVPHSSSGRFGVSEDAISDLAPDAIESMLLDGARRRGVTVDDYRDLIEATASRAGVTFEKALQVIADFENTPWLERKVLVEHLALLKQEAARYGMSISRFVTTMLDKDDGASPARH